MNLPKLKVLELEAPSVIERHQPARFGWWSDGTLMIVKGGETLTLDGDDLSDLSRFVASCPAGGDHA